MDSKKYSYSTIRAIIPPVLKKRFINSLHEWEDQSAVLRSLVLEHTKKREKENGGS